MNSTPPAGEQIGNYTTLRSGDGYALYFNQLLFAFRRLMTCYTVAAAESRETDIVRHFLERLLYDVEMLRLKFSFQSGGRDLWIDATDSGFPNHAEIAALGIDLEMREETLHGLPAPALLRRLLVDELVKPGGQPDGPLSQLARRAYFERLDADRAFLPFAPGEIVTLGAKSGTPAYMCSWGCYDFTQNRPYIHLMTFEHDRRLNLTSEENSRLDLRRALESEGSRAPDLAILAMAIDEALEPVHPKILKRLCIGPLYSRILLEHRPAEQLDARERIMLSLLQSHTRREDECILFFSDEAVVSKRQSTTRSLFAPKGRVREIFYIPENDVESLRRRASVVHNSVLLPHSVAQHITPELIGTFPAFGARLITYDRNGEIHGI